jgi:hypothetical protein
MVTNSMDDWSYDSQHVEESAPTKDALGKQH